MDRTQKFSTWIGHKNLTENWLADMSRIRIFHSTGQSTRSKIMVKTQLLIITPRLDHIVYIELSHFILESAQGNTKSLGSFLSVPLHHFKSFQDKISFEIHAGLL